MEELVQRIDLLIEVISRNSIPVIIEILGVFVPILISILLLLQDRRYNKRNIELQKQIEQSNEKLQRELSLRDEYIQMREEFLKIYDDFCLFQRVIGYASMQVHIIFSNYSTYGGTTAPLQWINQLNDATNAVVQATNRATLLLPSSDQKFKQILQDVLNKAETLNCKVSSYYNSGLAYSVTENAWNTICPSQGIQKYDYQTLTSNYFAYDSFIKLCTTPSTKEIESIISELLQQFEYDRFDKYFEPYLQMGFSEVKT